MTAFAHHVSEKMSYEPLVTIAIPTFNRASLLDGCITAALGQTYRNFEVLVSDNASTDETPEMLKQLSDRRLRVVRQERNIGLIPNLNALLELARGKFVVFVPDDDRIEPWMLERCVTLAKSEPQISIVVTLCDVYFAAEGRTWRALINQNVGTGVWDGSEILLEFLEDRISASMCSVMCRTDRLRARGGFPLDFPYAADVVSWAPLLLEGRGGLVNESCARLALHSASQTAGFDIRVRVSDGRKVVDIIAKIAERSVNDPRVRRNVVLAAQRHFARRTITMLSFPRRQGASFMDMLPLVWQFRRDLISLGPSGVVRTARPLAILFLPGSIVRWIRRFKHASQNLSSKYTRHKA